MKYIKFLLFGFALLSFAKQPLAQNLRDIQSDIRVMKEEIESLQRSAYRGDTNTMSNASDLHVRLGEMDEVFRNTIGKIDEVEHKINMLNERLDTINKDFDVRFKMLEERPVYTPSVEAPAATTVSSSKTVEEIYQEGLEALRRGDNQTSINIFSKIVQDDPKHSLAGNAQYWLGEAYYVQKDFSRAAISFAKGYENYKSGSKGADSLLKLGMSMVELKKTPEACAAFLSLPKEFPKASDSLKTKAAEEAKKYSCK